MKDEEEGGRERPASVEGFPDEVLVAEMWASVAGDDAMIGACDLWIDARDGVIALTGVVSTKEERAALSALARTIRGCAGVENHVLVQSGARSVQARA